MRHLALRIWLLCFLMLVWVLLWGDASVANMVSGLAIALVITVLLPLPAVPVEGKLHPLSLLKLVVLVGYYLVLSSFQVAWMAIRPGPPPLVAVLRANLPALKSDLVLALAVNIFNLIPGSIVLEIDQARRILYVHVIDVGSDSTVQRFYRQVEQVQRLLVAAFERDSDWQPSAEREAGHT
ncbi:MULTISPECIES: Na+/H+ antiporter subunit E [unclassified Mycolicibacterium]|uniref:Na+/H+ antiporter subunit E n=1 Tax=unclassified Mycolicibacterium TaxID=2636767 RepID=UPI0012DE6CC0|nr:MULTISPECIES: Na+/H+ antiporter subunit E [unclassified Mycolicibacterium]MUL81830.1 Na+/H+ antiporter subunit E [Mycolicibacterium sp. CBMA 329]MUL87596.1 Na+/H+ antiporter subunit E [Mycolicibacterium sp. CBMA 331]MUL99540.1 Na+/H+ antiporter subunit E [Mycolicibacterium sp. CBMA 334]MUM26558.1 Na+/H+ antiporter subunit E [Mycolicibacterium sp. CBMA 295]MUM37893.1 Na+/H+ antiporter subunit E [Mycolicibacterium sp. CBMA 247]